MLLSVEHISQKVSMVRFSSANSGRNSCVGHHCDNLKYLLPVNMEDWALSEDHRICMMPPA